MATIFGAIVLQFGAILFAMASGISIGREKDDVATIEAIAAIIFAVAAIIVALAP